MLNLQTIDLQRFYHYLSACILKIYRVVFVLSMSSLVLPAAVPAELLFEADKFDSADAAREQGWGMWSPRDEIRPTFFVIDEPSTGGQGSLGISGNSNSAEHGCWFYTVEGIEGNEYYRFETRHAVSMVPHPRFQVVARLDWRDDGGKRTGQPEYVPDGGVEGKWQVVQGVFRAPEKAAAVRIELFLSFCDQGTVWWDGIRLERVDGLQQRMVRVATVNCYPQDNETSPESVEEFCAVAEEAGRNNCDIVCLGEGVNLAGVRGKRYSDIAETIPGPTTQRLGEVAQRWNMYIVAALGELDGHAIYNTAVLIGRDGKIKGKYRKVQLPREEIEAGVTPGSSFPVFDTDFGRIGMMVCWDNQYAEPARALAVQGAEILFMPIWGGNTILTQARAIENQVYVVSCGYSIASTIYDPWGKLLAEAENRPGTAYTDIDLNKPLPESWLGNMRHRFYRELRVDIPVPGINR
ncbi:carbon-nitrogen hydrolase family protein [Candidatus Latescibacterota bacterium]